MTAPADPAPVDRSPTGFGSAAALLLAVAATVLAGRYAWLALGVGAVGTVFVLVAVGRGSRRALGGGAAGLFAAAIVAGGAGAPAGTVLAATVGAVLVWDAGATAIDLGAQLGRTASTVRLEAVHLAGSAAVGGVTAGAAIVVYESAAGGYPVATLLFLVVATALLLAAIDRSDAIATR